MPENTCDQKAINKPGNEPEQEISLNDVVFEAETGIMMKNATDIELHNVRVNTKKGAALQVENVKRLTIDALLSAKPVTNVPLFKLTNVQDVLVHNCRPFGSTKIFAEIKGGDSKKVIWSNNQLGDAVINITEDVKKDEVRK